MAFLIPLGIAVSALSLAFFAISAAVTYARVRRALDGAAEFKDRLQESLMRIDQVAHEAQAVLASVRGLVPAAERAVERLDAISSRASHLSAAVLDQVEPPAYAAVAVAKMLRGGVSRLVHQVVERFGSTTPPTNGDPRHE